MKAGIVIALGACARVAHPEQVAVLLTGDEEVGSVTSSDLVEQVARQSVACLVLEPSLGGALKTARKGGSFYQVTAHGRAAHAGLEPDRGRNALLAMARLALDMPQLADPAAGTTITPTLAGAGTAMNVVPDEARVSFDVRCAAIDEMNRIDDCFKQLDGLEIDGVEISVTGGINRLPMEPQSSRHLVELCRESARQNRLPEPQTVQVGGASDGNFTAAAGVPTLDGLGADGDGAHSIDEWVRISSLAERIALVATLIDLIIAEDGGLGSNRV